MSNKKFQDLVIFSSLPAGTKDRFISNMSNDPYLKKIRVTEEMIAEQISIIKKRYKYPSKSAILDLFEAGILFPVFSPDGNFILPTFIPSWLMTDSMTGIKSVVNLSMYAKERQGTTKEFGGELIIDVKHLFGLLQNGLVLYTLYKHENKIVNNVEIVKSATQCYTRMVLRCLDRLYALNSDKISTDRAAYVIATFFLVNILGRAEGSESVKGLAYQCCHNKTSRNVVESVFENYEMSYGDISSLFIALASTINPLKNVSLRAVLEVWTRLYGDSTLLALENFAQLAQLLASSFSNSQLCNEVMVNSVVGDYIKKFNSSFFSV